MWVSPRMTTTIRPAIISHGYHSSRCCCCCCCKFITIIILFLFLLFYSDNNGFSDPNKVLSGNLNITIIIFCFS